MQVADCRKTLKLNESKNHRVVNCKAMPTLLDDRYVWFTNCCSLSHMMNICHSYSEFIWFHLYINWSFNCAQICKQFWSKYPNNILFVPVDCFWITIKYMRILKILISFIINSFELDSAVFVSWVFITCMKGIDFSWALLCLFEMWHH